MRTILVTGGAGFIGSSFVHAARGAGLRVVNLDKLTYAGNLDNLADLPGHDADHVFVHGDICDRPLVARLLDDHAIDAVVSFAAESHVDRSIGAPDAFVHTNIQGTFELLEASRAYVKTKGETFARAFRFLQISTDEVFGSLGPTGAFDEETRYAPSSPYAASKAAADHLVRAYHQTYGLKALTTCCSNNYGPFQFPEKLIPLMILNALEGRPLPVYGDGKNVRDWLYVEDHCRALLRVLEAGAPGATYAVGGRSEMTNLAIVHAVCDLLQELVPVDPGKTPYRDLVTFVPDRPGHDRRYAIDPAKIERELGWSPAHTFAEGIRKTVRWYVEHRAWCARVASGAYQRERLGLPA